MTTVETPWLRTAHGANLIGPDGELGRTIFEEITGLAIEHEAINLGQGFPDTEGPEHIRDLAIQAIASGDNQYAPGGGIPALRQAISTHQSLFYGLQVDPDTQTVVTTGATEAIAAAVLAFANSGDEVVTFEPYYDSYGAMISLANAVHRVVPLNAPEFQPDLDQLSSVVNDNTKLIILNNPHNPTGAVFGVDVLQRIIELAHRHDCLIISDEVYEHLTFGVSHIPIAQLPGGYERTITISSAGKSFSFTGWKVGWATGPEELITAVRTVKQFLSYSSGPAFQKAVAQALALPDEFYTGFAADLGRRGGLLADGLEQAGMDVMRPAGTYFLIADVAPLGFTDAVQVARMLPASAGVAAIPLSVFCHEEGQARTASLLRFAFCKKPEVLGQAIERLHGLSGKLV
ncbi:aminotransferase class I/II-fold pyridoxal phosphate-dependent enzyme [Glutamicibacter sp. MNS18]|uniref:aminotransferase class I/II-fold pyridoxal phosphate-dependent enzyme n=1 Tax=Glutamicibacter sp. MNS18 TaxID=2989817 RepID=UPI0022368563|nr:aminotransferase class I/II-fold pyridoxal phosphate-dependent enzyme [Glutamicibacter sp. MNS18]MCW4466197.1 aminotransferase class I/II-fold pyridoxal phosphate-dependent enzyme [Glutamicibacter sp. MNS18]